MSLFEEVSSLAVMQLTKGKNIRALFSKDTTEKGLTSISQSVNIHQRQGSKDW
jgi:hypothetical protein